MNLVDVYRAVRTSKTLEKMSSDFSGEARVALLQTKEAIDAEIFDHLKTASPLTEKLMKGALITTAAALPLGAAGYAIINKADETSTSLQQKVLQTALVLAAVGGGLYGLHRMTSGEPKTAADHDAVLKEASEKLAAVGLLDTLLNSLPENLSAETQKLASNLIAINRGYGVHLLHELAEG